MTNDPARFRLSGMFIAAAAAEQRDEIAPFGRAVFDLAAEH